jgi:hypothetical protein
LQTEGYIRALTAERWPHRDVEFSVEIRRDRQRILHRPSAARFMFFVHENALRMRVGHPAIMQEQLLSLLLLDGLPQVAVRVVPATAGAQATFGGAFRVFEYANHPSLVYLDGPFAGLFLEDAEYVAGYRRLIPAIADIALNERQSRECLATIASDHDREGTDLEHVEEKQL